MAKRTSTPFVFVCAVCEREIRTHVGRPRRIAGKPVCASCSGGPSPSAPAVAPSSSAPVALAPTDACVRAIVAHEAPAAEVDLVAALRASLASLTPRRLADLDPHERRLYRRALAA